MVIFAPIIKRWANYVKLPATYFLIPLSYVTILGGICTLIGTSTNLVVHSMMIEAGLKGFSMFELGKVGIFVAIAGILYLFLFSKRLLPADRPDKATDDEENVDSGLHPVEAVIGPRFPGINKRISDFDFRCKDQGTTPERTYLYLVRRHQLPRRRYADCHGRRQLHQDLGRIFSLHHAGQRQGI